MSDPAINSALIESIAPYWPLDQQAEVVVVPDESLLFAYNGILRDRHTFEAVPPPIVANDGSPVVVRMLSRNTTSNALQAKSEQPLDSDLYIPTSGLSLEQVPQNIRKRELGRLLTKAVGGFLGHGGVVKTANSETNGQVCQRTPHHRRKSPTRNNEVGDIVSYSVNGVQIRVYVSAESERRAAARLGNIA